MSEHRQTIKDWPEDERPRERLLRHGASTLSDAQLLAIILRTGAASGRQSALDLARELLGRFKDFRAMDLAGSAELCAIKGIGRAKEAQIRAALEIGKRFREPPKSTVRPIRGYADVVSRYKAEMGNLKREVFKAILLDNKNRILRELTISEGSLTASLVHPREVFNPAIRESAAALIVVHNHPSGDPTPSREDRELTRRLSAAGELIGIRLLDHVILGHGRHVSFAEERLL